MTACGESRRCPIGNTAVWSCRTNIAVGCDMFEQERAGDGIRTHDNDVGNVVLYQLSYTRPVVA